MRYQSTRITPEMIQKAEVCQWWALKLFLMPTIASLVRYATKTGTLHEVSSHIVEASPRTKRAIPTELILRLLDEPDIKCPTCRVALLRMAQRRLAAGDA